MLILSAEHFYLASILSYAHGESLYYMFFFRYSECINIAYVYLPSICSVMHLYHLVQALHLQLLN